jgi:hypothetical protein
MNKVLWKDGGFRNHGPLPTLALGPHDGGYVITEARWTELLKAQGEGCEIRTAHDGQPVAIRPKE